MGCTASTMGPTNVVGPLKSVRSGIDNIRFTQQAGVKVVGRVARPAWLENDNWMNAQPASGSQAEDFDADEALEALETFCTQAGTGTIMAFIKEGVQPSVGMLKAQLVTYLNRVYTSILKGDDEFVQETFARFGNHSPACVLWLVEEIVWRMIDVVWVNGGRLEVQEEEDELGMDRIYGAARAQISAQMISLFQEHAPRTLFDHVCDGASLEELREMHDVSTPFFEVRKCNGKVQKVKARFTIIKPKVEDDDIQLTFELDEDEQQCVYTEEERDDAMNYLAELLAEERAARAAAASNGGDASED